MPFRNARHQVRQGAATKRIWAPPLHFAIPIGGDVLTILNEQLEQQQPLLQQGLQTIPSTWQSLPLAAQVAVGATPLWPVATWLVRCAQTLKTIPTENTYPESVGATYELSNAAFLWENPFLGGEAALAAKVRPLLKQTQLEFRPLRVVYNANRDGYNGRIFHNKVDGQGAAVVLVKTANTWLGGYNPRGWASLGGSRPSRASFLFYTKKTTASGGGGWQKLRVLGGGGMSCGNDLFDAGIYMGAEGLVIPLDNNGDRSIRSRLGTYFETGPEDRGTLLPRPGMEATIQELYVLVGVYDDPEDIPNSGGVLDLGLY
ncbi:hypothetical protein ACA910_006304 [Epithemia clementina (nom. ined.)]